MKYILFLLALCVSLASCNGITEETTMSAETVALDSIIAPLTETTEIITTAETTVEITTTEETTTEETTTEETTTEETTTEVTTTVSTTVTTAATTAAPKPVKSAHVPSVLDGEYTYGGEPIIENIDGITYVNGILIANKTYSLPETFNPGTLHPDAKAAFEQMKADAAAEGLKLKIVSGYRSYRDQINAYTKFSKRDGQDAADRYSARPGHSEHQTGLAMDINSVYKSFADTPEGIWLAANCTKYGFILRYPEDKEAVTGYMYEPWHIRYVGVETAAVISESGLCLEEFLGITSVYAE